jgi:hypothetical protein
MSCISAGDLFLQIVVVSSDHFQLETVYPRTYLMCVLYQSVCVHQLFR